MKALITGGAGFIGSHLSDYLLSLGYQVVALDDLSTGRLENIAHLRAHPDFSFVEGTILNQTLVDDLTTQVDVVFHLAAAVGVNLILEHPVDSIRTNVLGSEVVLSAAHRHHKKILIASTSEVYGKGIRVPFREDDDRVQGATTKIRWSYANAKAMDEFLALAYHQEYELPVIVCRFFNTVGPRQTGRYGMVIPRFVKQALANEPLTVYGDGTQSRCFCDVSDVVKAITALTKSPQAEGEVFNIGNPEEITIIELAKRIIALTNSQSLITYIPYEQAYQPGFEDMQRRVPSIDKIIDYVNWQPSINLSGILKRVITYYQ